ncbi:AAA family ATPase [Leptolyngbya sp. FACHB-261]|uniref:AAA family ATPase n=1 Tax=Leptolyngbya sp. FACHB-261 TaxID=2692806 RepID=UPI001687222E|nr:AAA family ATPase [Leptolyngbya sp. FACHB-261]MBD2101081.1 AAA family ATPase [Leptolyngbya sp. FACHB-261]
MPSQLIILIGLPASGKSTLARMLHAQNSQWLLVSTDALRAELFGDESTQGPWNSIWRQVEQRWYQAIKDEVGVIYDATNVVRRQRRGLIVQARNFGFEGVLGWWLDVPLCLCLQRNQDRLRQVPEAVIERMHRRLSGAPPSLAEGFDGLIRQTNRCQVDSVEPSSF